MKQHISSWILFVEVVHGLLRTWEPILKDLLDQELGDPGIVVDGSIEKSSYLFMVWFAEYLEELFVLVSVSLIYSGFEFSQLFNYATFTESHILCVNQPCQCVCVLPVIEEF
jgi:hypothetical protein